MHLRYLYPLVPFPAIPWVLGIAVRLPVLFRLVPLLIFSDRIPKENSNTIPARHIIATKNSDCFSFHETTLLNLISISILY